MARFIFYGDSKGLCPIDKDNIVAIGDSLANGYGMDLHETFVYRVASELNNKEVKLGINGEVTSELLDRMVLELDRIGSISAIIISIGGNDFIRSVNRNIVESNLDKIVKYAKQYSSCIVVLGVPSDVKNVLIGGVDPIYKNVKKANNIILDDTSMPRILKNRDLKLDHIHPNVHGHKIIADNIVDKIKSYR